MNLGFDIVVVDLETNGLNGSIIQIGAVKLKRDGIISGDTFNSYVKCQQEPLKTQGGISIDKFTGIDFEDLKQAPSLYSVTKDFESWALKDTKNIYLSAWGDDIYFLKSRWDWVGNWPFRDGTFDIRSMAIMAAILKGGKLPPLGLESLMKHFSLPWNNMYGNPHNALADAFNTAVLLSHIIHEHKINLSMILRKLKQIGLE